MEALHCVASPVAARRSSPPPPKRRTSHPKPERSPMSSARFLRSSLPRHLSRLLTRTAPVAAADRPFAPHRSAHPHVLSSFVSQRAALLSWIRSTASHAADAEAAVVPRSVQVTVAHELLKSGHSYLDVRTVEEFSDGHAVRAVNIPFMFKSDSGMSKNLNFIQEVCSIFKKDDEIIVGCRSGKRSLMAASELSNAGFTGVTDVAGGYSAWVENGLPTEH